MTDNKKCSHKFEYQGMGEWECVKCVEVLDTADHTEWVVNDQAATIAEQKATISELQAKVLELRSALEEKQNPL